MISKRTRCWREPLLCLWRNISGRSIRTPREMWCEQKFPTYRETYMLWYSDKSKFSRYKKFIQNLTYNISETVVQQTTRRQSINLCRSTANLLSCGERNLRALDFWNLGVGALKNRHPSIEQNNYECEWTIYCTWRYYKRYNFQMGSKWLIIVFVLPAHMLVVAPRIWFRKYMYINFFHF